MSDILKHLQNAPAIDSTGRYCAIIGESPSKGARSPSLWNAVFEHAGMDVRFYPFDVRAEDLGPLLDALRRDDRFAGGSVAVPYKTTIIDYLDETEPLAATIGAVNALYRDGERIVGTNSDGAGALHSLLEALGRQSLAGMTVVQVGTGGAGLAVAAYLADSLADGGSLKISNRDWGKAERVCATLGKHVTALSFPPSIDDIRDTDIFVNCTSIGYAAGARSLEMAMTPLGVTSDITSNICESVEKIQALPEGALVFDIVYQPLATPLITIAAALGRQTLSGLGMNLEQAVIAFCKAFDGAVPAAEVRTVMGRVS